VCDATGSECLRFTTSGSLGTFYATVLARAYTGRERVLKVAGGWHGSQPFGLKGVTARNRSFDHLESEGLSAGATEEIGLTRFNDIDDLHSVFRRQGERLACFVIEPVLGAGGGMVARRDYLLEARRLTAEHGALLLCDEIITAFRFRAGDCAALYGVQPDLLILGKILGGGMPVAAVAGRRRVLELCTRAVGRVKFEGGTYSAHELSLVAARAELRHLREHGEEIYPRLAVLGERARRGIEAVARSAGLAIQPVGTGDVLPGSSLVLAHAVRDDGTPPACPEELAARAHPRIGERLLKATLLLEDVSVRTGLGAISTAHTEADVDRSLEALGATLARFRKAGLV
jgi:glutamate-1-semialdehyde 2,1-aminomutase